MGKARRKRRRERRKARRARRRARRRKKGGSWFGRTFRKVGKIVGKAAQIVAPIASILPLGGALEKVLKKGGKALEKVTTKLAPIASKVDKVNAVLGSSRINKMITAVDKKGVVNTESIKNTLIAKGIAPHTAVVNDVKSVLQKVVEVKKEIEQDNATGLLDSMVKIPVSKIQTKSSPTAPIVSADKVKENQSKVAAVYGRSAVSAPSRDLLNPSKKSVLENIKLKMQQAIAWVKMNPKKAALFIALPIILIGAVVVYIKKKSGGSRKRGRR